MSDKFLAHTCGMSESQLAYFIQLSGAIHMRNRPAQRLWIAQLKTHLQNENYEINLFLTDLNVKIASFDKHCKELGQPSTMEVFLVKEKRFVHSYPFLHSLAGQCSSIEDQDFKEIATQYYRSNIDQLFSLQFRRTYPDIYGKAQADGLAAILHSPCSNLPTRQNPPLPVEKKKVEANKKILDALCDIKFDDDPSDTIPIRSSRYKKKVIKKEESKVAQPQQPEEPSVQMLSQNSAKEQEQVPDPNPNEAKKINFDIFSKKEDDHSMKSSKTFKQPSRKPHNDRTFEQTLSDVSIDRSIFMKSESVEERKGESFYRPKQYSNRQSNVEMKYSHHSSGFAEKLVQEHPDLRKYRQFFPTQQRDFGRDSLSSYKTNSRRDQLRYDPFGLNQREDPSFDSQSYSKLRKMSEGDAEHESSEEEEEKEKDERQTDLSEGSNHQIEKLINDSLHDAGIQR